MTPLIVRPAAGSAGTSCRRHALRRGMSSSAAAADTTGMPDLETLHLRTNGIRLHAVAAGPQDGPLVILLHGFPEFWWGWRRQIGPLAATGLRVLVPDQRGYNLSDKPAGSGAYRLDLLADDVLGLADALGRKRFAVVGHDWGAILAWHLAARDAARVERAAVLNGPHLPSLRAHLRSHPFQAARSWYAAFFQLPLLPEWSLRALDFAALRRAMLVTSGPGTFAAEDLARYREAWAQPGALTSMLNWYRALPAYATKLRPDRIEVPVQVIWGDRDQFLDRSLAEAGLALCRQGKADHLPMATHWVQHEEAAQVNRLLIGFLAGKSG